MKPALLTIILIAICSHLNSQSNPNIFLRNISNIQAGAPSLIDYKDTVIFNMSKAVINGVFIDIPISINADDDIVALDFALAFDNKNLKYNSIINHTGYITHNEFLHPGDLKLRMSSYSLNRYDKDTIKLLSIRFELLAPKLLCTDFKMIEIWLNGSPCSYKLICPDGTLPVASNDFNVNDSIIFYPNPAKEYLIIESPENVAIEILDLNGKKCMHHTSVFANQKMEINLHNLANGIYLLKVFNGKLVSTQKLFINH